MVAVLLSAGDQAPLIALVDAVGKGEITPPAQIGGTAVKVGVTPVFTVIVNVVVFAHRPVAGVNV